MESTKTPVTLNLTPGSYIVLHAVGLKAKHHGIKTVDEAVIAWTTYRDNYDMGASDMANNCGDIFNGQHQRIGLVYYNGCVVDLEGTRVDD